MKYKEFKKDERLGFWHNFLYEFGLVFLIVFCNSYGLIWIYNSLIGKGFSVPWIAFFIIMFLVTSSIVSAILVYITRARIYSRNLQKICSTAQRVANGDFSVRLDVFEEKKAKTELDILKEDFNKMVEQLSSVESLQNDFLADVSHEIKTPLSIIQGYADLLKTPDLSRAMQEEYIRLISEAIHKLNDLVTNILMINKLKNTGIFTRETYFLDEQIRCSVLSFEEEIERKNLGISVDLQEVSITATKLPLELVWNNLISNAIKYTPKNGKIEITLKEKNSIIIAEFKDNGCGMDEKTLKHIFDKFYQGDTSHSGEGNGLGLALVKKVIEGIGGKIKVKSKPDNGSVFTVVLYNTQSETKT